MATLTAEQLEHIRAMSGDDCGPEYEVSDIRIQYLYDTFGTAAPLCMSQDPLGNTIVWVLRQRVRKAAKLFNEDGENGTRAVSQKYDHLKEQLKDAEAECGYGPVITVGRLSLGLDTTCEDVDQWWSQYAHCSWWRALA